MRNSCSLLSRTLRGPLVEEGSEGDEMAQVGRQGSSEEMYLYPIIQALPKR